jgi:hypothetical protein
MQGVEQVNYNGAEMDADNEATATGLLDSNVVDIEVDGTSNLATRILGVTYMVTPNEANTGAFYLAGSAATPATAFVWKLNGSEINFPYAPIGYSHITTNFEIANSGSDNGEVLLTAFDTMGTPYSANLPRLAEGGKLTAITGEGIASLFGLTEGTKLSLTFTTSAPAADIKATGYSVMADNGGRMTLLSDAYEGESDKANCVLTGTAGADDLAITCN